MCKELRQKAKQIIEERRAEIIQNQSESYLEQDILEQYINEQTLFFNSSNNNSNHETDYKGAKSAVEIYFSFYTIP